MIPPESIVIPGKILEPESESRIMPYFNQAAFHLSFRRKACYWEVWFILLLFSLKLSFTFYYL